MRVKAVLLLATAMTPLGFTSPAVGAPAPEAVGCGAVVTHNVTLQADITGCANDGLVVGADGIRINLNGHTISGSKTPGSVGIRNIGRDGVRIEGGQPFAAVQEFEIGILVSGAASSTVVGVATRSVTFGIRLEHANRAILKQNDVGFFEGGPPLDSCATATAPAGILLLESDRATVRDNLSQLTGFGILLVRSDHNLIKANGAAPSGSDGNSCSGIVLVDADDNTLVDNVTTENRTGFAGGGDGIFVDSRSDGTIVRRNTAATNTDDGIDVESRTTTIVDNTSDRNDDLGIEAVKGVTASGNAASGNGNPLQCLNVVCA